MKKIKVILRRIALILLIILGCFGIGIVGPVPLLPIKKKDDEEPAKIEMVDEKEEDDLNPF
ncbi:hypothetical protein [Fulvivirga sedimenti]|uniref:Lipoprotein n=1 Tax=Fulvivirga sedimenti TaxID=2879465 RepID=A0A9X1KWP9_9BACT|nr:hypothetical protein [Fulvivirga sedimenti]MCA6074981.1 hypothetical protein [Fulvivirga sedimenti]MCA6076158.1 hypothetical protein [Fulvivirga sedimenti]MCA6077286.1 hypothetical protein [Fulvivirga sedimenti]